MNLDHSALRVATKSKLPRFRARRCGALAAGAFIALALGALGSTAGAYQYDHYSVPSAVAPETTGMLAAGALNPSPGCGKTGVKTGTFTLTTTDGANRARTFMIVVPTVYNPNNGYALGVVYHGAGGTSADSHAWGLQNASGASTGGIFVFPQGINYQSYGIGWDDTTKGYDLPFFDHMVTAVEAAYCVNTKRIFAAGFSWGGDFVTALTCDRGNVLRAVAVNSATDEFGNRSDYKTYQNLPCIANTHAAMRYEHALNGDSVYPSPDFATTSNLYKALNACASTTTPAPSSTNVMVCVAHNSCSHEFVECSFNANIGHTLPPNWASDTWAFFQTFD